MLGAALDEWIIDALGVFTTRDPDEKMNCENDRQ